MANNPDLYTKGTPVRLSAEGKRNKIARPDARGTVTSKYPVCQVVTVQWDYRRSKDRLHVDFLEPLPAA